MEASAVEPTLVEVKPEYLNIYRSMTRVDFEVWDEAERRLYEGQILSVTDNRVIIMFPPEGNETLSSERGNEATICYTVEGDLYRGDCRVLNIERLKVIKVTASRPTEVSRSQLRSSIRWDTKLEQCTIHRAAQSDPSNWESYPFIVTNISHGGFAGQTVIDLPTGGAAQDYIYAVEIALPWSFGTFTLPASLLGSDPTIIDGRPGWRYRASFIDAPAENQDVIIRYINRSQIELRLRGNTGPPGPLDPITNPSADIDQRMRIARRDFQSAQADVAIADPTEPTLLAEPAVEATAAPAPAAPAQPVASEIPAELDGDVTERQRRVVARAHSLGAKATELAREIVSSGKPQNVRKALPLVRGLLTELGDPEMFQAFARTLDTSSELYTHSINVSVYAMALGSRRNYDDEQMLELATGAFLHDIGMTAVPDEIVKKTGALTPQEWVVIRRHPHEGRAIAASTRAFSPTVLEIIEHHQERYDGSGYPDGLRGDQIGEGARIVAIADAFDALTVQKPYRTAYSLFKALTIVRDEMATGFDRLLLRDFIFSLGKVLGSAGS